MSDPPPSSPVEETSRRFDRLRQWLAMSGLSLLLHFGLLALFALIVFPVEFHEQIHTILGSRAAGDPDVAPLEVIPLPTTLDDHQIDARTTNPFSQIPNESADLIAPPLEKFVAIQPELNAVGPPARFDTVTSGRTAAGRARLVKLFGGSAASEAAVNNGLAWLASIQHPDGHWSFREIGGAPGAGTVSAGTEMGATACALLCFLGAGHTHQDPGRYQQVVARGFVYLREGGEPVPGRGYDYRGPIPNDHHGGMYIQGLVAIAFAEGYGMTHDRGLHLASKYATKFIVAAQDHQLGGWRYTPGQDSDTSVVGWQLMALKSAQRGGVRIPLRTFTGVSHFLSSVAAKKGARYGYTNSDPNRPSTTAIGLLCQMYLGWDQDHPALKRGVAYLATTGPNFNDFYYLYYATQVLHNWGGEKWKQWNKQVRDGLVARQIHDGPAAGSWDPTGSISGSVGGRLFDTCLAIMTLEVYYRYLPLYDREDLAIEF